MSWIFGFYSKRTKINSNLNKLHPQAISIISNDDFYIAIGGNSNTIFYDLDEKENKFFLCGIPIAKDTSKILTTEDIKLIIRNFPEDIKYLNGHFVCAVFNSKKIILYTDLLGLREIHVFENDEGWYFATRLDWLLKLDKFEIDFEQFGSRWKLVNQISNKSIVKKIQRLNCGTTGILDNQHFQKIEENWIPGKTNPISGNDFSKKLKLLTLLGEKNDLTISLSLSGGMDSRVLLSYLLNSNYKNWNCHIFQTDDAMDTKIAEKILYEHKIKYKVINQENPDADVLLSNLFEYIGQTYLTGSAYDLQKLLSYKFLPKEDLIIDGGFGEIWRREFLNRLLHFGKNDLINKNYQNIYKYLNNYRVDIFTDEFNSIMSTGIINQLEEIFSNLPVVNEPGLENWLDLFSLKTRLVNFYGTEQARIDSIVKSYMPFVQLSLINNLFNLPIEKKKNNYLFKKIIKNNSPDLLKYRQAKGNISYPVWFSPLIKRIYFRVHKKLFRQNENNNIDQFLSMLKEFIFDSLLSGEVKDYNPYNYKLIIDKVHSYYNGEKNYSGFVNWFLTFEIFRQIVEQLKRKN